MVRLSMLKSPTLKDCANPLCRFQFWGYGGDKYCSPDCARIMANIQRRECTRKWREEHPEKIREYNREYVRRHKKKYREYQRKYQREHRRKHKERLNE